MAEELTLTTPETFQPVTVYKVINLTLHRGTQPPTSALINIALEGNDGSIFKYRYEGEVAWTLLKTLNTLNLSTPGNSLNARVLSRLSQDGIKVGVISGLPEL